MPRVLNVRNWPYGFIETENAVKIDRTTEFGNPFIIGRDGDRDQVCQKYEDYWNNNPALQESTKSLKGKDLLCWCHPLRCHGDFLLQKANEE